VVIVVGFMEVVVVVVIVVGFIVVLKHRLHYQ